jgi:hypothetical protein
MGNFVVKNQTSKIEFEFTNNTLIVQGKYEKNVSTSMLMSYTGSCYRKNQQGQMSEYIGNFNGFLRSGSDTVKYSFDEMTRQDSNLVWDAIEEIEPYVIGEDNGGESE